MSDSVAADQLAAFVDRIRDPRDRLSYVLEQIEPCRGISGQAMSRAFSLASVVFGVDYEVGKAALQFAFAGRPDLALPKVGRLTPNAVGFVYHAVSIAFPGAVKIGFSGNPDNRAKRLTYRYGAPVEIAARWPGTMLAEHAEHCRRRADWLEGEWYGVAA